MFSNRLSVTEIMILLNQAVTKFFMPGSSDQAELNGLELFNCGYNRRLIDVEYLGFFLFGLSAASERPLPGRERDVPLPVKLQHESPANSILKRTVGLSPIPLTANSQGQRSTALIGIVSDDLTEKVDIAGAYDTFTISEYLSHVRNITDSVSKRTLFFMMKMTGLSYLGERLHSIMVRRFYIRMFI